MKKIAGILLALLVPIVGTVMTEAPAIWPVSTLIYNLGLFACFSLLPRSAVRVFAYNLVATIFFIIEASFFFSYYLQNAGFNGAFFYHLRADLLYAGVKEHLPVLALLLAGLAGFLFIASSSLDKERGRSGWKTVVALVLLGFGLFISPPARALFQYAENLPPTASRKDLFVDFPELQGPQVSTVFSQSNRPNIVLIYAESLEQRFFDESVFPGLLPKLTRFKAQSIDFANVSQGVGAGWTIGGMVASQCGYPLTGSHDVADNNLSMFAEFLPKATCLGDLLQKDGYRLTFMGGADARFAGKKDFLESHGYREIVDLNVLLESMADKSYQNPWGIYDDTLFDKAIAKFNALSQEDPPFLLTLLTLDNHGPVGYLSKSCGDYGAGDNSSLNSIHCTDQLLSGFIEKIRNSPYSERTVIIVLSDHLAMRNKATPLLQASQRPPRLTFFVNTPDGQKRRNDNPGLHYDIAPTVLDLLGYRLSGQMGFGASLIRGAGYLPGRFRTDGWRKQGAKLMAIAGSLWDNDVTLDQNGIRFRVSDLNLAMGGREFDLHAGGIANEPASTLFFFDDASLKLEKIEAFPLGEGMTRETLSRELLKHKDDLSLAISRAENLPGFSDPRIRPDRWVFFCGKPGSNYFSWGPITSNIQIPFDLIQKLSQSKVDDRVVREREDQVKSEK